ncbi:MAG: pyridoxal-phosphate dependent enzyme [Alphaproteobacteria bacterium]|nr:pyridoxal-phosphate dependent enzyme [Alphaproteobacteria bacterium]
MIARAADWPLQVYVPTDAEEHVLQRLATLGAEIHVCPRDPAVPGDPAVHAFRKALERGALPFSVQGDVCGIAVEGGRTLGWELADQGPLPDALFVQVGGGALASAVWQGLRDARALGLVDRLPRLYTVQTEGAWPLRRAWQSLDDRDLERAARERSRHMWPWETPPHSVAHGILDDETYDWWSCCQGMQETGGDALVVEEAALIAANEEARAAGFLASPTGSAGLAGLRSFPLPPGWTAGVLLTGRG